MNIKVLTVFGTRPEAIKLAPVIRELERRPDVFSSRICVTGQHREMLDQMLDLFGIRPDYDLDVMRHDQSLTDVTVAVLGGMRDILEQEKPDWVLVQGDTTTTMAGGLGAFHQGCKVAHVEAGLRTFDNHDPWPEEMNRRVAGVVADLHFAPTEFSAQNLYKEGISEDRIYVTGNTVIDALQTVAALPFDPASTDLGELPLDGKRVIIATMHRRETSARAMEQICTALVAVAEQHPDVQIICPVHLNPNVQRSIRRMLDDVPNITLLAPLDYQPMVWLLQRCHFVVTDSGGLQEEVTALGKPVLVVREKTERPEGIAAGTARLVGTDREAIETWATRLLREPDVYAQMARSTSPYGSGDAARRIADVLLERSRPAVASATSRSAARASATLDVEAVVSTGAGLRSWLSSGAPQSRSGAFVAWVDLARGRRAHDYPEITGYALTYLAAQQQLSASEEAAGGLAAVWLLDRVRRGALAARDGWDNEAVYLFDLGIMATGLISFGRRIGDTGLVDAGRALVGRLDAELGGSTISAISPRGPESCRVNWSTCGLPHLAKLIQPSLLCDTGSDWPRRLIEAAKCAQRDDGRIESEPGVATTTLHPHLYAAEGLWMWGSAMSDEDALDRARAAVEWAWTHQLETGGLPRAVADPGQDGHLLEQSDVTAQAARLALLLDLRSPAVDRGIARLVELARPGDGGLGIVYQPDSRELHLNTWATLFAAQALALADPDSPLLSWQQLV